MSLETKIETSDLPDFLRWLQQWGRRRATSNGGHHRSADLGAVPNDAVCGSTGIQHAIDTAITGPQTGDRSICCRCLQDDQRA
jgi:hypothetical protein